LSFSFLQDEAFFERGWPFSDINVEINVMSENGRC